ncbi:ANTAR domain-containing protein [Cellulomonas sp. ES6]|uniref:ANTAR domain-containing protein n=1 Tax=Cellulomonas sp. ES6 TaxID=3039384 RepID=UPI0024B7CC67|nr:ANTAR domain-containing protein [Cellulomonas sp. ES6]WHP18855.1 ANTAR domain-containing protein [Cellulomonas sp. ES6]
MTAEVRGEHRWLSGVPDIDPGDHLAAWDTPETAARGSSSAVWNRSADVLVCVSVRVPEPVDWAPARANLDAVAATITAMVVDQQAANDLAQTVEDLTRALHSRPVIDQAIGVIMAQSRCSPARAMQILRSASQHRNRKVHDVASSIVEQVAGSRPAPGAFVPRRAAAS